MKRLIMEAALLLTLALGGVGVQSTAAQDSPTCADFSTYDEAYAAFAAAGGPEEDPYRLDPDRDGYPCEDVSDAPSQARTAPENAWGRSTPEPSVKPTIGATKTPKATETPEATETPAATEAPVDNGDDSGTNAGTGSTTASTNDANLPITGSGPMSPGSVSPMTLMLASLAGVFLLLGATSLVRGRRG